MLETFILCFLTHSAHECQAAVLLEEEMEAIAEARSQSMKGLMLEPYFDAGLIGGQEEEEAAEEDVFKLDYLAPFLPNPKSRRLTRQQAIDTRDACLQAS